MKIKCQYINHINVNVLSLYIYIWGEGIFVWFWDWVCFVVFFFNTKEFLKISVRPKITKPKLNFSESEIRHLGIGK